MHSEEWQKIKEIFNAAYDLPENERAEFLSKYDENLRLEAAKLFKANQEAENFIDEPAMIDVGLVDENPTDNLIGKRIDSYEILQEIGQGGMGTVYLASRADGEFEQRVALKLIKRGMDTNAILKRFMLERQILARLEHPNIAHLIDGGTTADGLPYFVMEYIEGLPITTFCDSNRLSTKERLNIFQAVCSAIAFAHQNLVVHRDIKPSNIIVTTDGTPKLLDFGIAKLLNPEWSADTIEATATMFRVLTPEYASPEQLRGLPITTSADVYSLGVVLYELLSGQRPYKIETQSRDEFINAILTEEPVRPSSVVSRPLPIESNQTISPKTQRTKDDGRWTKSLKGDLDNIILKALRKEPERRYSSVQEFCEDIRRHLEGLPVKATADTTFYRIGKFVQRHRTGVFAAVFVLLILISSTIITTRQWLAARFERDKAEQHFAQVRKLADTILFEYHDEVAKLPGSTALREKMVKDALEYLDNLSSESANDADLQRELAAAYQKVGDVQANLNSGAVGNVRGALESFQKSLRIREKLAADNPENTEDLFALAVAYGRFGNNLGNFDEAARFENYSRALKIYEQLNQSAPNDVRFLNGLAQGYFDLGFSLKTNRENQNAIEFYRKAIAIWEKLFNDDRTNAEYRRNLALGYKRLGEVFDLDEKYSDSIELYRQSLILDEESLKAAPDDLQVKMDLSFSYGAIGYNLMKTGDLKNASDYLQKTLEMRLEIAKADPKRHHGSLGRAYERFGELAELRGDFNEAAKNFQKGIEIFQNMIANDDADVQSKILLAQWLEKLGSAYEKLAVKNGNKNLLREACSQFQNSVQIWERAAGQKTLAEWQREAMEKVKQNAAQCE